MTDESYWRQMGGYFDYETDPDEESRKVYLQEYLAVPGASEKFRAKFREMMSDSSRSYADKFAIALGRNPASEDSARAYIENWWKMAFDEPWVQ